MMEELLETCRSNGLRVTHGLRVILTVLNESTLPQSLQDLEKNKDVITVCDRATIFRTLQRLEGIGLLRRLNFSHTGAKFSLNKGESHEEYLICKSCGDVQALEMACPVHKMEKDLTKGKGYQDLTHELTFYGLCPTCQ